MIPYGFGDPITGFENSYRQADPDTPHLTTLWSFGGWATSGRGAFAFAPRTHNASTLATHGTRKVGGRMLFLYLFFTGFVHGLGHGHGLGVVVDLDWTFGWSCGVQKVALPHLRTPW